jgi:hypothetical protein
MAQATAIDMLQPRAPQKEHKVPTEEEYLRIMNDPHYRPPIERMPTPARSDTFTALMTKEVMLRVFARYKENDVAPELIERKYTDLELDIMNNPTLGTTPQRELILQTSTEQIRDYRHEEAFQLWKTRMFNCCFVSNFFGITLMLYSISATVIFEKYDEDKTAFICSFIFYIPAVAWFVYVYLPCKTERERRKRMRLAIKLRNHQKKIRHSYFHGHDDSDEEDFAQAEKQLNKEKRKLARGSGSFTNNGSSRKASGKTSIATGPGGLPGESRKTSVQLPKAPARSSLKVAPSERKASVQFKVDK